MHECVTSGHGPVSVVLGFFQWTVYGVAGPVMAATMIWLAGSGLSALICAAVSATVLSRPEPSADTQFW